MFRRMPSALLVLIGCLSFPLFGVKECNFRQFSAGFYSKANQLESHRSWLNYEAQFGERALSAIRAALPHYLRLKAEGHPHIKWMESVGFVFGPDPKDIKVPNFGKLMVSINRDVDAAVAAGKIPAGKALRPARIFYKGDPKNREYVAIEYGQLVPPGFSPVETIIPFPVTLRLMKEGVYPIGEPDNVGPRGDQGLQIFPLHDLAHFSMFIKDPEYMAAIRDCATNLSNQGAYYRAIPDIRTYHFSENEVRELIRLGAVKPKVNSLLPYSVAEVNRADGQQKLNYQALLVQSGNRPMSPRQAAGMRFNLLLEGADLLPRHAAVDLFNSLSERNWLPVKGPSQKYDDRRYNVAEVIPHLQKLQPEDFRLAAQKMFETYTKHHDPWGGVIADGIQPVQRKDLQPQGFTYYYSLNYLYQKALASSAKGPGDTEAVEALAKFQVALLESGRFTIHDWARDVSSLQINPNSEVSRWLTQTGAFPRDLYFSIYGGNILSNDGRP